MKDGHTPKWEERTKAVHRERRTRARSEEDHGSRCEVRRDVSAARNQDGGQSSKRPRSKRSNEQKSDEKKSKGQRSKEQNAVVCFRAKRNKTKKAGVAGDVVRPLQAMSFIAPVAPAVSEIGRGPTDR